VFLTAVYGLHIAHEFTTLNCRITRIWSRPSNTCPTKYNTIQYSFITVADRPLRSDTKVQKYNKQTTGTQDSTVGQYCD